MYVNEHFLFRLMAKQLSFELFFRKIHAYNSM